MTAKLVVLPGADPNASKPDLLDVPALLRRIAQDIDDGLHGVKEARELHGDDAVVRAVLVLRVSNRSPAVFGLGAIESIGQTYMDLHAGAQELMNMKHPERS